MPFVLIQDGVVVQKQQSPEDGFTEAPGHVVCGFLYAEGEFAAPEVPSTPTPPHLNSGGLARFSGALPVTMIEQIRMAGVTRISKGRYRVTHETAMPSDQYSVNPAVMDANPRTIRYTARTANYVEVRVTDLSGVAQDAVEIIVETKRVITP